MTTKCKKCGIELDKAELQQNGMCVDCFAKDWGELVELSPIVSQRILSHKHERKGKGEMKEQKYKFWDTEKREMHGPHTLDDLMLGPPVVDVLHCLSEDTCKVLQYTNLKDKNGTEIYHKDILLIKEDGEKPVEGIVEWTDIGWSVNGGWLSDSCKGAEVIRSHYERKRRE